VRSRSCCSGKRIRDRVVVMDGPGPASADVCDDEDESCRAASGGAGGLTVVNPGDGGIGFGDGEQAKRAKEGERGKEATPLDETRRESQAVGRRIKSAPSPMLGV
jgi:hypothetical protein